MFLWFGQENKEMLQEKYMKKEDAEKITNDVLIADALLRIKTIENLLIEKGIISKEEFSNHLNELTAKISKTILDKANMKKS